MGVAALTSGLGFGMLPKELQYLMPGYKYPVPTSPSIMQQTGTQNTNPVSNYSAAVTQQAGDYDSIMNAYMNLVNSPSNFTSMGAPVPITPQMASFSPISSYQQAQFSPISSFQQAQFSPMGAPNQASFNPVSFAGTTFNPATYSQSPEWKRSLEEAARFVQTGGVSGQEQQDIRARGISPIRSVYANAQMNLDRQRRLQGGYSPNYTAATSKMARDMSSLLSDKVTDVNGMIAQMLQGGRIAGLNQQSNLSAQEQDIINRINLANSQGINQSNQFNAAGTNQANMFNSQGALQANQFNANAFNDVNQFNSQGALQANLANASGINNLNQFNASGMLQAMLANAQAANQANQLNFQGINQTNQLNAGATNTANQLNASNIFNTNQFNAQQAAQQNQNQLSALGGAANMYSATPGLVSTYGNQMVNQEQLGNQSMQQYINGLIGGNVTGGPGQFNGSMPGGGSIMGGYFPISGGLPSPGGWGSNPVSGQMPISSAYFS